MEKGPSIEPQTYDLCSIAEFQSREPRNWPLSWFYSLQLALAVHLKH